MEPCEKHQINHIIIHHIANRPSCIYTIYIAYRYEYNVFKAIVVAEAQPFLHLPYLRLLYSYK